MRAMKGVLKEWNRDSFGNVGSNYRELVEEIEQLDARLNGGRFGWLRRDKNTKFFHRQARIRMVRNGIMGIQYNGR
ncbi:hypothetical protein V6N12_007338 [Hibiscus sabdariffa]|uniref:Uncharacterized protein n=1 Tax=Hibiscus sabdariffa TaxID=183260 RepID=A0ABR2F1J4_9ROSI